MEETIRRIDDIINEWKLTKEDKKLPMSVLETTIILQKNPLDLYVLMCFSFNYQFRFNSAHEYNNPFREECKLIQ